MKKILYGVAFLIVIGLLALLYVGDRNESSNVSLLEEYTEVETYSSDTVLTNAHEIMAGESLVLENEGSLTASEEFVINGALGCRDGSITLIAEKQLTINDTVACNDGEDGSITIVAEGGLVMGSDARIVATGNVQIVDSSENVRDDDALEALYDEVETIPESGTVVGPFVDEEVTVPEAIAEAEAGTTPLLHRFFNVAHAQVQNGTTTVNLSASPIVVSGKIVVKGPIRKGVKRVVVFDFPNTESVTVQNFELEGPEGRKGDDDSGSCDVAGKKGEDAFRFNAFAPNLTVNNFTLVLGDGGEGGEATTGDDCEDAKAKGGKGGKPGNFRMIGSQNFEITGAFIIHPGAGGAGGGATAKGRDGDANEKGGNATATGGDGSDNKKKLTVMGTVAGTSNVEFGDAVGGVGGYAKAEGGKGGDADKCGVAGATGGNAVAKGGRGGDAKLTVSGGARRMDVANDIGGEGGGVEAIGGEGGKGGDCDENAAGGTGGTGGTANATEGKGGQGKSGPANDGPEWVDQGGDGGTGGEGCEEGKGGEGGKGGTDDGEKGEDGRNICITITKEEDYISLLPGEIEVIQYMDYYIPIANGNVSKFTDPNGAECDGEEHWHPGPGGAINTMGYPTPDPDANNCGFGKTSEVKVQIIQDPNYVEPSEESNGGGGEMIQIDPPVLVIPAN